MHASFRVRALYFPLFWYFFSVGSVLKIRCFFVVHVEAELFSKFLVPAFFCLVSTIFRKYDTIYRVPGIEFLTQDTYSIELYQVPLTTYWYLVRNRKAGPGCISHQVFENGCVLHYLQHTSTDSWFSYFLSFLKCSFFLSVSTTCFHVSIPTYTTYMPNWKSCEVSVLFFSRAWTRSKVVAGYSFVRVAYVLRCAALLFCCCCCCCSACCVMTSDESQKHSRAAGIYE